MDSLENNDGPHDWIEVLSILTKYEVQIKLNDALASLLNLPNYEGHSFLPIMRSFVYYKVFNFPHATDDDLRFRYPEWSVERLDDELSLCSRYGTMDGYLRIEHTLQNDNTGKRFELVLIGWCINEPSVSFSSVKSFFNKTEYRELLKGNIRPLKIRPHLLVEDEIFNNYYYILDSSVFSVNEINDEGSWTCRAKNSAHFSTVTRKKMFDDTEDHLYVKENENVLLPIFRRIFCMRDKHNNVVSNIGVQYVTVETIDYKPFGLKTNSSKMSPSLMKYVVDLLATNTVEQAYRRSLIDKKHLTRKQIENAARNVVDKQKGCRGAKPLTKFDRDSRNAFLPAGNVHYLASKDMVGRATVEIISVFEDQWLLFLKQCTTHAELIKHRRMCDALEEVECRKTQQAFIEKHLLKRQDASGNLKCATVLQVDTTFGLSRGHVVTLLIGLIRGFRTTKSLKPRYVLLSAMAHQKKGSVLHRRHVEIVQNVIDVIIKRHPELKDARCTSLLTDGEQSLQNEYSKLSVASEAQPLGCGFHLKRIFKNLNFSASTQSKIWGSVRNGVFSGALLSAMNESQFHDFLYIVKQHVEPFEYNEILKRSKLLYNLFSLRSKLRGGIIAQYATTNSIENINSQLTGFIPGSLEPGFLLTKLRQFADRQLSVLTSAATNGDSNILCDLPIRNWGRLSESERSEALNKRCLKAELDDAVANLNSLFVEYIGPHTLNNAARAKENNVFMVVKQEEGVFVRNRRAGARERNCFVTISEHSTNGESQMSLECDAWECRNHTKFCEHRLQALLVCSKKEQDSIIHSFLENETSIDDIFRKQVSAKEGHKIGKRTFGPLSYANRPRNIGQFQDDSLINDVYESDEAHEELDEILELSTFSIDRSSDNNVLELTSDEECGDEEADDLDASEFFTDFEQSFCDINRNATTRQKRKIDVPEDFIKRDLEEMKTTRKKKTAAKRSKKNERNRDENSTDLDGSWMQDLDLVREVPDTSERLASSSSMQSSSRGKRSKVCSSKKAYAHKRYCDNDQASNRKNSSSKRVSFDPTISEDSEFETLEDHVKRRDKKGTNSRGLLKTRSLKKVFQHNEGAETFTSLKKIRSRVMPKSEMKNERRILSNSFDEVSTKAKEPNKDSQSASQQSLHQFERPKRRIKPTAGIRSSMSPKQTATQVKRRGLPKTQTCPITQSMKSVQIDKASPISKRKRGRPPKARKLLCNVSASIQSRQFITATTPANSLSKKTLVSDHESTFASCSTAYELPSTIYQSGPDDTIRVGSVEL